jgi:hypothetical protein
MENSVGPCLRQFAKSRQNPKTSGVHTPSAARFLPTRMASFFRRAMSNMRKVTREGPDDIAGPLAMW